MLRILIVAFILLVSPVQAQPPKDQDPWPMTPGWSILSRLENEAEGLFQIRWYNGETMEFAGHEVMVISEEWYGNTIGRGASFLSRNAEGDVFFHGLLYGPTGEVLVFDPPLLYLDLPLSVGKTWEVDTRRFDDVELSGDGVPERLIMTVEALEDIATPTGVRPAWKIVCEVIEGDGMGTDWFAPGQGLVRFSSGQDGPLWRVAAMTWEGPYSLPGIGDPVALEFGWKPGLKMAVLENSTEVEIRGDVADTSGSSVEYFLEVNRTPMGLLIHQTGIHLELPDSLAGDQDVAAAQALLARMERANPDFLVDRKGEFQRLMLTSSHIDSLFAIVETALKTVGGDSVATDSTLTAMRDNLTPAVIEAYTASEWNQLIGSWSGAEAETGVIYDGRSVTDFTLMPGVKVPVRFMAAVAEPCPCNETDTNQECVRLISSSRIDAEAFQEIMNEFLEKFGPEHPDHLGFDQFSMTTDIVIIMEPDNMHPHEFHLFKHVKMDVVDAHGNLEPMEEFHWQDTYFTYPDDGTTD